ncbi:hypothetical protein J4459_02875 [Candidatus Woesearchaeota archaeon]|nr:hypothetical protein [Candidatus Woesearchaeota archaeon]
MANISIFLFGRPSWELPLLGGEIISGIIFKELGEELGERLHIIGSVVDKLIDFGWKCNGGYYDIWLYKEISNEEARIELEKLGLLKIANLETMI